MKSTKKTPGKQENIRALSDQDLYLFNEGNHLRLYDRMGAHPGKDGTRFAVWAPNAKSVHVIGDFNGWNRGSHPLARLHPRDDAFPDPRRAALEIGRAHV